MNNTQYIKNDEIISPIRPYNAFDGIKGGWLKKLKNIFFSDFSNRRDDIDYPAKHNRDYDSLIDYETSLIREQMPWEGLSLFGNMDTSLHKPDQDVQLNENKYKKRRKKTDRNIFVAITALIGVILVKIKFVGVFIITKLGALLLQLLGTLNLPALLAMIGSMFVTIFVYAQSFGLQLAVGFVFLTFMHEIGHVFIIMAKGLRIGWQIFIPFFGAFVSLKDIPRDAITEAQIALGGPFLGSIASLIIFIIGYYYQDSALIYIAYAGFIVNLFNLTPVNPLDGGKIVSAISKKAWIIGFLILLAVSILFPSPSMILMMFFSLIFLLKSNKNNQNINYYNVPYSMKVLFICCYFALVIFLAYASFETYLILYEMAP